MDVRVRCCSLTKPAADGSIIGETVVRNYLDSEEYKLSVDGKLTLGYLTHRGRSLDTIPASAGSAAALKKVVGRDDSGLVVAEGVPTFTHYVKEFYIDDVPGEGPWLCALVHILDEKDGFDEYTINNIKRLKALIRSGICLTCSLVVVAYWQSQTTGYDVAEKIKTIKSLDWTYNPSFGPKARIFEVIDDEEVKEDLTKTFSDILSDETFLKSQPREGELKVKTFSDIDSFGLSDLSRTSKINGVFTKLKVKEFSSICSIIQEPEAVVPEEKEFSMASTKERLREAKMGPRMEMRRLYISYKQLVKSMGGIEKIKPEDLKLMKSMFSSDILRIMNSVSGDVMKGKQINTLLGLSSLSKTARVCGQKLQQPLRLSYMRFQKQGFLTKDMMQKLQGSYTEFVNGLMEDVFGPNPEPIPEETENENENNE